MRGIYYACEYWNGGAWIKFFYDGDLERCRRNSDAPIFGDPKIRIAKYEVSGKRWRFLEKI